jgi:hypothetical protein
MMAAVRTRMRADRSYAAQGVMDLHAGRGTIEAEAAAGFEAEAVQRVIAWVDAHCKK